MTADIRLSIAAPKDLVERDQWVLWRYEIRHGKQTKIPYQTNGKLASSTDPATWTSFERVNDCFRRTGLRYTGIGFVFSSADPFAGIDLDDCLDPEGNVKAWARSTIEQFADSYMEVSPSGTGVKVWVRGALPENRPGVRVGDGQIELFDHARYFALTSRVFRGAPLEVEDHAADLLTLYEWLSSHGRKKGGGWPLQPLDGGRIPHGQQHSTLVSIAGTLRARHVCDEAIEACLQIINERQCERPGPRENISRIIHSSRKWGAA
jgi:Primase C terminal 1 (PriCT-1)